MLQGERADATRSVTMTTTGTNPWLALEEGNQRFAVWPAP